LVANEEELVMELVRLLASERQSVFDGFRRLVHGVKGLSIGRKWAELVALAIGIARGCSYCVEYHAREALKAGASRDEILDVISVALMMCGGPALPAAAAALRVLKSSPRGSK